MLYYVLIYFFIILSISGISVTNCTYNLVTRCLENRYFPWKHESDTK